MKKSGLKITALVSAAVLTLFCAAVPAFAQQETETQDILKPENYVVEDAIDYADTYALDYNPDYANFNSMGGDCANFVAQCLFAGGLTMDESFYYNSFNDRSASWISSTKQLSYLTGKAVVLYNPDTSQIYPGNPIYYFDEDGDVVHTAICVGYDENDMPIVNAHNNDRYHVNWQLGGEAYWTAYATVLLNNPDDIQDTGYLKEQWIVTTDALNFRTGPETFFDVYGTIPKDTILTVTEKFQVGTGLLWGKVKYNENTGWIALQYAQPYDNGGNSGENPAQPLLGDANSDGKITVADVMRIRMYVAELIGDHDLDFSAADVTRDGKITAADVMRIRMYVAELISSFDTPSQI